MGTSDDGEEEEAQSMVNWNVKAVLWRLWTEQSVQGTQVFKEMTSLEGQGDLGSD